MMRKESSPIPDFGNGPFEDSVLLTQWALEKAWKIAVRTAGITDWSITKAEHPEREYQVETMQMEIAKMILSNLNAIMERRK